MDLNLFLLSGGTRVPVHVGAVAGLLDTGAHVNCWAGVSAGSLVASVFAAGYSTDFAYRLMLETQYQRFLDFNPVSAVRGMGLASGRRFELWLNRVLEGRTFADLDVPLTVVATDVETGAPFLFSNERTPRVTLAKAVRCSISVPGIFALPRVDGRVLMDGCFASIRPQHLFPVTTAPSLVVRLKEDSANVIRPKRRTSKRRLLFSIIELILRNTRGLEDHDLWDHHLPISVGQTSGLDFRMPPEQKQQLYLQAYEAAVSGLTKIALNGNKRNLSDSYIFDESFSSSIDETALGTELTATSSPQDAVVTQDPVPVVG